MDYGYINEDSVYRCMKNIPCENGYFEKGSLVYVGIEEDGTLSLYDFETGCKNGYLYFDEYEEDEYMNTDFLIDRDISEYLYEEKELSQKVIWYENAFHKARNNLTKFDKVDSAVFTVSLIFVVAAFILLLIRDKGVSGLCVGLGILSCAGALFCVATLVLKRSLEKEAKSRYIRHMKGLLTSHRERMMRYV